MGLLGRVGFLAIVLALLAGASYVYDRIAVVNDRDDAKGTLQLSNITKLIFEHIDV